MFDSIFFNGDEYNQMWLNGNKIWEKQSGVVDEYPEYDTVVVYYVGTGSVSSMFGNSDYRPPKIDSSLSASYTHLWTDGKYECYGLNNYYPSGQDSSYSNIIYPVQIRKVSLPKGVEYADGSLTLGSGSNKFIRYYCGNATSVSSKLYPPYIDWTFFDCRKVKEIDLVYDNCNATTIGNIGLWDITYLTNTNVWGLNGTLYKIQSLDLSGWNTSNIVDMSNTFYGWTALSELNISTWNTSNVTDMGSMFYNCTSLKELDLSSFDTSKVTSYSNMFKYVSNCTIYIGDGWTLGTTATFGGGTNNTFIKVVPIESIDELICSEDVTNITSPSFTISATIAPSNWAGDLEVIYDSTYLTTSDNFTFVLQYGSQGRSLDITYRSKKNPTISRTITFYVNPNLEIPLSIDFTQSTAPMLPIWFEEQQVDRGTANYIPYTHKLCSESYYDDFYGLVVQETSSSYAWSCYKVVAMETGVLTIKHRNCLHSSFGVFNIYCDRTLDKAYPNSTKNNQVLSTSTDARNKDSIFNLDVVQGETYYLHFTQNYAYGSYYSCIRSIALFSSIKSINGFNYDVNLENIEQTSFTVSPVIKPSNYNPSDVEVVYDSTYMTVNPISFEITLKPNSQGMSHTVTYRSKADNSISKSFTFYVNADLEIEETTLIDFTQSTAPTLPYYMTEDGTSTYKFNHGLYTTDVYGLIPNNKGKDSSTAYTRYKYVAPTSGDLTFTYRCSAETNYDYLTVHVDTSTSQPSTTSTTNQVFTTQSVSSYQNTDGTASISVVEGTTYYIHIQYYKDSSASNGYDKGCIRKIELVE